MKFANFKILWDADWLVNLGDEHNIKDKKNLEKVINKIFLTNTGKKIGKSNKQNIFNKHWEENRKIDISDPGLITT